MTTRQITVTLEVIAVPQQNWQLENGSIEPTQGYRVQFPDGHSHWVDERDYEDYYLRNSPTGLLAK